MSTFKKNLLHAELMGMRDVCKVLKTCDIHSPHELTDAAEILVHMKIINAREKEVIKSLPLGDNRDNQCTKAINRKKALKDLVDKMSSKIAAIETDLRLLD